MNLGESHDQAQIEAKGCDPLKSPKDRQTQISRAIGARIVQAGNGVPYQTRPHHCDAKNADAHADLDAAVAAAYSWPSNISEEEALAKLFELNQARAAASILV